MNRSDFRHLEPLRVRWAEVDMQKIVFNGHYLMYMDTAVAGYWRAGALPYDAAMHTLGGDLYVRKATLEYAASARYDEQLAVGVRCARIGTSSLKFLTGVFCGERLLVQGELIYVYADPHTQTSRPVPPALRDWFTAFEAGEAMLSTQTLNWADARPSAEPMRRAVLVEEAGFPAHLAGDEGDEAALHLLAHNRLGQLVGCGRLLPLEGGVLQLGRLCSLASLRGAGIGTALVQAALAAARQQGAVAVELLATRASAGLYARQGFVATGADMEEGGVVHRPMLRVL
jgi:YbgC/YbaW family acyl-CoA thioester hydrolase